MRWITTPREYLRGGGKRRRLVVSIILALIALTLLLMATAWLLLLSQQVDPRDVQRITHSCEIFSADGQLIEVTRGYDYRYSLPVSLQQIPQTLIDDVIAIEDRNFWQHRGVDWLAGVRALGQLLGSGRILSGASTITMQVVNQYSGRGRGLWYKFRQCGQALNWERTHSKEEVLQDYFNLLPYGGKLQGIEAASRYYFGRHVQDLNRSEQLLLVGLPQSPNRFRPDRHPVMGLWRRDIVITLLERCGRLSPQEAADIRRMPLRFRDFTLPCWQRSPHWEYVQLALQRYPNAQQLHLALDLNLQQRLRTLLTQHRNRLTGVMDGAGVIIDNSTGCIRAIVGTLPDGDKKTQMVNAATAWRSPGSALKPFIYGEAINGGLIVADTILEDAPIASGDYRPGNFDGRYRGQCLAAEALADSLNTPSVRLLDEVGVVAMVKLLHSMGVLQSGRTSLASRAGLSLALGGVESQLLALTAAYSSLGSVPQVTLLQRDTTAAKTAAAVEPYWLPGTTAMVLSMLRTRSLPGAENLDVAWKTGTSNGNRDAWCFAVTPQWTVGIWVGNRNGKEAPALVGAQAAAPVAGQMLRQLMGGRPILWPEGQPLDKVLDYDRELCVESGLAATPFCRRQLGTAVVGVPLRPCQKCRLRAIYAKNIASAATSPKVLSPMPGVYILGRKETVRIPLHLQSAPCHLYVNGEHRGQVTSGDVLELPAGKWLLLFWHPNFPNATQVSLEIRRDNS